MTPLILAKAVKNWAVGVDGPMTMGIYLPIGYTQQLIPVSNIRPAYIRPNQYANTTSPSSPLLGELANQTSDKIGPPVAPPVIVPNLSPQTHHKVIL